MAHLREVLEKMGYTNVQTYIQSGNVLLDANEDEATLCQRIEKEIEKVFGFKIHVIVRAPGKLKNIVANLPFTDKQLIEAEASSVGECLYVSMLKQKPHVEGMEKLKAVESNDQFRIVGRDIYLLFYQSIRHSKLANQVEKLGIPSTTRNWRTINKLSALSDERTVDKAR